MSVATIRYAAVEMPDGWNGRVYERAGRAVAGSRAAAMAITAREWRDHWPRIVEQGFTDGAEHVIKTSAGGQVARIRIPFRAGPLDLICKQSRASGLIGRLASVVRTSPARMNFVRGNRLLDANVATAVPLAIMHRRRAGIWRETLLITEAVQGAVDLDRACQVELRRLSGAALYRAKAQLIRSLVQMLAGVLSLGLYHRDMKAPNILVTGLADSNQPVGAVLVDLDGLRRGGRRSLKRVWQPVMRLNASLQDHPVVTRTDRLRVLQLVLWTVGQQPSAAKGYWRMLDAWTAQFLRRQRSSSRGKLSGYR
jgi:hypothetical protein